MDKKLRETTNLREEIMNRKQEVKGRLGHVVQKFAFAVNVMLDFYTIRRQHFFRKKSYLMNSDRSHSKDLKKISC